MEDSSDSPKSKRQRGRRSAARSSALDELKAARSAGKRQLDDAGDIDNVYDVVDVDEYSELVSKRQNDDWIVDDDGGYTEDGREIFDEEMGDEADGHRSTKSEKGKKVGNPAKIRKKASDANATSEDSSSSTAGKSIKNMILNMGASAKRKPKTEANLDKDDILGELLGQVKTSTSQSKSYSSAFGKPKTPITLTKLKQEPRNLRTDEDLLGEMESSASKSSNRPFTKIKTPSTVNQQTIKDEKPDPESLETEPSEEIKPSESNTTESLVTADTFADDDFIDFTNAFDEDMKSEPSVNKNNRGFETQVPQMESKSTTSAFTISKTPSTESVQEIKLDPGKLPLITNDAGDKVLRMYWLDAFEDQYKLPGTVWLFGKVYIESAKTYVSCCVTVKNIERQVFLLAREKRYDLKSQSMTDDDCGIADVYAEFNEKISPRFKITEHKSKQSEMKYAFEHTDVPDVAQYLQVLYSPKYPALPTDLKGETFSHVFGANQSSLERFLLERKIKGPCWLDFKMVTTSDPPSTWCKLEALADSPHKVSVVTGNLASPPVTILALNMKTTINPKTHQNEITLVSGLTHQKFFLDRPAPSPPYTEKNPTLIEHFCALTRPSDEAWPFDLIKALEKHNKTAAKVDKMDSERALLGFLLAKIGKIDPDIIIGHDVFGFDMEVLLHRTVINKIPNWSRLGRLRRSQPLKGRFNEKQATTGRLLCDLKISAKELIRCKSYDLGALVEKLLPGKPQENRKEVDVEKMRKAYMSSKDLLEVTSLSLQDAADILQCICELNALPLALQITQVAGNVMSRTLLGGRAERNEFLLLHAFHEKGYIPPDKQYGKKAAAKAEDGDGDLAGGNVDTKTQGRRKPAYVGGLVLEPKKGFYDNFILLMDFNSLYPSIIQEYNICFTTVDRKKPQGTVSAEDYIPEVPDESAAPGVLPTEIRKLVESRSAVKKLLKDPGLSKDLRLQYDIRQKALKLTANSMYGCLGFSFSRFYAKPLAALVTSRGREILLQTKSLVEKMNLEVIYGDTDSIMINSNSIDYDEVFKLGAEIKAAVNKTYKLLELDVDGVYRYMLLLKKKKYAAVTVEKKPNGQMVSTTELKGLDIVRRDWCQLAANTGKDILAKILSDCSYDERVAYIHERLEAVAKDLRDGKTVLSDLEITKTLTKDPNDYPDKKSLPHVQVALRMNSKDGKKLRAGDTVPYVICEDGSQLAAMQRAYHTDEVKDKDATLKVDIHYYLAQQLHPVVSRLCDPLDGTDASRIAQCLGLDPEQYRRAIRSHEPDHDDENQIKDEDRFRQCQKFEVTCNCGEKIILDSITRGSGKDLQLALLHCPNVSCQRSPLSEKFAVIKNKLVLAIRHHIQKYYASWIICEDPGCTGRTRRLALAFQRAFPVCTTCYKATMYREYTESQLYTQLLYLQTLFNLHKLSDTHPDYQTKFKVDGTVQSQYNDLYGLVKRQMMDNKYCMVSLNKVFEGFFPRAADDRKMHF